MNVEQVQSIGTAIRQEIAKGVVGQDETVELLLVALFSGGHVLLEGPPGTAKTLLAHCFAHAVGIDFGRIQFTPDLMPGDIIGANLFDFKTSTFTLTHGPIFTELLGPRLTDSAEGGPPSRVINVSSVAHTRGRIHFDDVSLSASWTGYAAYAQSKLAQVMHAMTLADRHEPSKLLAYSVHPGVVSTKLLRQGFGPVTGITPEAGANTSVRLAGGITEDEPSGSYYSDGVATPPASAARDEAARQRLWDESVKLAKL